MCPDQGPQHPQDRWSKWYDRAAANQDARDSSLSRPAEEGSRHFGRYAKGYLKGHRGPTLTQVGDMRGWPRHINQSSWKKGKGGGSDPGGRGGGGRGPAAR